VHASSVAAVDTPSPARAAVVTALLAAAMAAGTLVAPVLAVLASFLLDELGLSRTELGTAFAVYYGVAGATSPWVGRLTDRVGGRRMLAGTFLLSAAGFLLASVAGSLPTLAGAAAVGGLGQAAANPSTNKLLTELLPAGRRGLATGLKQSGVQAGLFLVGVTLPSLALAAGWRTATATVGAVFAVLGLAVTVVVPRPARPDQHTVTETDHGPLPRAVVWLAVYGALMGAAGGAFTSYLPLFAEEGLGLSIRTAGVVAAVAGASGFVARITWSALAERARSFATPLGIMAGAAVLASLALVASPGTGAWLLWVGAVAFAATGLAWNSVGMLAVMHVAGPTRAGRASGIVLLGFLAGFSLGPPAFGWSVDATGAYTAGLAAVGVCFALATVVMLHWSRDAGSATT
jgi:predicted MFS family arabinose efflux permease